jgi:hypothetical protein
VVMVPRCYRSVVGVVVELRLKKYRQKVERKRDRNVRISLASMAECGT